MSTNLLFADFDILGMPTVSTFFSCVSFDTSVEEREGSDLVVVVVRTFSFEAAAITATDDTLLVVSVRALVGAEIELLLNLSHSEVFTTQSWRARARVMGGETVAATRA